MYVLVSHVYYILEYNKHTVFRHLNAYICPVSRKRNDNVLIYLNEECS